MDNKILSIKDLVVKYGNIEALKGIDLDVPEGKVIALLGANGAGKTTTLKTISGLVEPESGSITLTKEVIDPEDVKSTTLKEDDITGVPAEKIAAMGIVQSPEGRQVFMDLTVEENLKVGAFTIKDKNKVKANLNRVYGYFPVLKERKKQVAATLSGGEQQMLAIGRALMASPKLLLLDEPSLGLAPIIVQDIFKIIKEINKEGTTVLIVEQNALQTLKISDYAYVLEVGEVKMKGPADVLIKDNKLIEAYLGSH